MRTGESLSLFGKICWQIERVKHESDQRKIEAAAGVLRSLHQNGYLNEMFKDAQALIEPHVKARLKNKVCMIFGGEPEKDSYPIRL